MPVKRRSVGLLRQPRPAQARSVATIERALAAASVLLATHSASRLRLSDVTALSGVSNGSLVHHFGSREGLIAAAQAVRHARGLDERLAQSRSLGTDDERLVDGIRDLASKATTSEHDEQRRARFQALAFARHVPELREVLIAAHQGYADSLAQLVEAAQARRLVRSDVAPRAMAAFALTSASGRFVDELLGDARPAEEWRAFLIVLLGGILVPEIVERLTASSRDGDRAPAPLVDVAASSRERPMIPTFTLDDVDEERVLSVAAAHQARSGDEGLRLADVLAEARVSRTWFARRFVDRATLLDLVSLRGLVAVAHVETAALETAFDTASSADDLLGGLARPFGRPSPDATPSVAWDRLELLLAAQERPSLREDAAKVVAASCDRVALAIEGAQQRGLVRADVAAVLLARHFWVTPLMTLVAALSDVSLEEIEQLTALTTATLITPVA